MRMFNYFIGACVLLVGKISSAAFVSTDDQTDLLLLMLEQTKSD